MVLCLKNFYYENYSALKKNKKLSVWNVSGCLNGSAAVLFNPSTAQASQISELKKCTHTHGYSVFSCLTTKLFLEQKQQQKEKEKGF